jgi:hypothetical protein
MKMCRLLKRTRFLPLSLSRHCRAGLSHATATRLEHGLSVSLGFEIGFS